MLRELSFAALLLFGAAPRRIRDMQPVLRSASQMKGTPCAGEVQAEASRQD